METCTEIVNICYDEAVRYQVPRYSGWKPVVTTTMLGIVSPSDTKYRDIADGNNFLPQKDTHL